MDRNQFLIEQLKLKYSNELNRPKGERRRFSANFKSDFLAALEESKLTQTEFCAEIGICSSLPTDWRRRLIQADKKPIPSMSSFRPIQVEEINSTESQAIYIQHTSGIRVYGLKISEVAEFLRLL